MSWKKAFEFLKLIGEIDSFETMEQILKKSDSATINLIALQTVALFKESGTGDFNFDVDVLNQLKATNSEVKRRVEFLMR